VLLGEHIALLCTATWNNRFRETILKTTTWSAVADRYWLRPLLWRRRKDSSQSLPARIRFQYNQARMGRIPLMSLMFSGDSHLLPSLDCPWLPIHFLPWPMVSNKRHKEHDHFHSTEAHRYQGVLSLCGIPRFIMIDFILYRSTCLMNTYHSISNIFPSLAFTFVFYRSND